MDDPDRDRYRSRRLQFTRTDFDDFIIALTAKLRLDETADRILSGELQHPLINFQNENAANLQRLNIPYFPPASLLQGPAEYYVRFLQLVTQALSFVGVRLLLLLKTKTSHPGGM